MKIILLVLITVFSCQVHAYCFESAGEYYGVNPQLLKAIAIVESDLDSSAINKDENSLGLMQIHPWWFSKLLKFEITPDSLISDPCVNVNVGAWILAGNFNTHGKNWNSIGAYNAGFSKEKHVQNNRNIYIIKVKRALSRLKSNDGN